MTDTPTISRVLVTGATGFVGRNVVRKLLARGIQPVCIIRDPAKLFAQHRNVDPDRLAPVTGSLSNSTVLEEAARTCRAAIHLVGIIVERRMRGQTFRGIHVEGTRRVLDAVTKAGITRYMHMSALGSRANGISPYHQTKWAAEELVRKSGLNWTIFRPSLIHGPEGEFMRLMKAFVCGLMPPAIPYFGSGRARLQPVSVSDVAHCFVESLFRDETIGQVIPLGGPKAYSWIELYNACRALMPGAKRWKPLVSQPVWAAKVSATLSTPVIAVLESLVPSLGMFRFDTGQVQMSQEDNTCDHTIAERMFGMNMRNFEEELATYADQI